MDILLLADIFCSRYLGHTKTTVEVFGRCMRSTLCDVRVAVSVKFYFSISSPPLCQPRSDSLYRSVTNTEAVNETMELFTARSPTCHMSVCPVYLSVYLRSISCWMINVYVKHVAAGRTFWLVFYVESTPTATHDVSKRKVVHEILLPTPPQPPLPSCLRHILPVAPTNKTPRTVHATRHFPPFFYISPVVLLKKWIEFLECNIESLAKKKMCAKYSNRWH